MITATMALDFGLGALGCSLFASVAAALLATRNDTARFAVYGLLAVSALLSIASGITGLLTHASVAIALPVGLPWLPMHMRLDALGAFFLLTIGALLIAVSIYSIGYVKAYADRKGFASLGVFMGLFVAGMQGIVLADDAFTFMLFWELMSVSSYFFVTFEHEHEENRKAGYVYLIMAHVSGLLILGSFATLYASAGSFEFSALREAALTPFWASAGFLLAAFGFGMKAGVVPMHVWLPEAHPVAPSNASSLMSGIMIKVAIFGFIRVVWDLIGTGDFQWWWGTLILLAGSSSAVTGVLLALQQHDLKRLLAYHSVENIGIILIGLGLGMIFSYYGHPVLAALGLIAGLYHTINHALFKGLLFMGAGAVLHATGTRNMEKMGGLIHRMPVTSVVFLVACVSISALPPFNGFVSEWLTFQTALLAPNLEGSLIPMLIPFSAAMLALAGALAATCFVKVYGIVFLGQPRSPSAAGAHEIDGWMKFGMVIPAVLCLLLGILPTVFIPLMDAVPQLLMHASLTASVHAHGWLWLTPISEERASYSAPIALLGMLVLGGLIFWLLHPKGQRIRRVHFWSCGNPHVNTRMQYTATSFAQPLRRIFSGIYQPVEHIEIERPDHKLLTRSIRYEVHAQDISWRFIYRPLIALTERIGEWVAKQHQRGVHAYLAYMFVTVLVLLGFLL